MRRAVAEQEATLRRLSSGVEALVRRTFLDGLGSEDGQLDVVTERFGMTSQGEEDGIVVALLRRAGVTIAEPSRSDAGRTAATPAFSHASCAGPR